VRGDALLLEEAVSNLIDNALRYAGRGARVTVRLRLDGAHACVEIEDNGPGVPVSELPHLGARFHRCPGSPAGGSGLGLSIVREVATLHGGSAAFALDGGLRVTLTLPAQAT
jgi:two-component system sensor histidine kinase TctE